MIDLLGDDTHAIHAENLSLWSRQGDRRDYEIMKDLGWRKRTLHPEPAVWQLWCALGGSLVR